MSYYSCSASSTASLSSCSSSRYLDSASSITAVSSCFSSPCLDPACSMAALSSCFSSRCLDSASSTTAVSSRSGHLTSTASLKPSRFTSSASKIIIQCKEVSEIIISYAPEMSAAMGSLNKCYRNAEKKLCSQILKKFCQAIGLEHYTRIYNSAVERLLNISNFDPNNLSECLIAKNIFCNLFKKILSMGGENFLQGLFPQADISKPSNVINCCTNPNILERMALWVERHEDENLLRMFKGLRRTNLNPDAGLLVPLAGDASSSAIHERAQNIRNWLRDHNDDLLSITWLDLSGLQLTFIPPEFTLFRNLDFADLSNNQIIEIHPYAFNGLGLLRSLDLSNNEIRAIHPYAFNGLGNLSMLVLGDNQINAINPNTFAGLGKLETLYLNSNQVQEIHSYAFNGLEKLEFLYIKNNQIRKLHPNALAGLGNLRFFSIDKIYLDYLPDMRHLQPNMRSHLLSIIHLTLRGRIMRHFQSNIKIYNIVSTALSSVAMAWSVSILSES